VNVFLDSSALTKRYIKEAGSDEVDAILAEAAALGLCVICYPEIISALARQKSERRITAAQYTMAKEAVAADLVDASICNITPGVVARAVDVIESGRARAMDALHIGAALEWDADIFVSSDRQQLRAARKAGLKVKAI